MVPRRVILLPTAALGPAAPPAAIGGAALEGAVAAS